MQKTVLVMLVGIAMATSLSAQTIQQWDACAQKVYQTTNEVEDGVIGVTQALQSRCGERPIDSKGMAKPDKRLPFEVFQAAPWQSRFQALTGEHYAAVKEALTVSGVMTRQGAWLVGSGYDPKGAGASAAAIAVNTQTGQVMAVYNSPEGARLFGFDESSPNVPKALWEWVAQYTAAG